MNYRIAVLLVFLFPVAPLWGGSVAPAQPLRPAATSCLAVDRSGCAIRINRGVNKGGYYLTIETGARGNGSVEVGFRGRSIVVSRSEFRRTERTGERGGYGLFSRSSRFASRVRLPPDADIRRARRVESDGVITIVVPRLQPTWSAPAPYGYGLYR